MCNQLPLTRVEKIAVDNGAIVKTIAAHIPASLKKGKHSAIFKIIVDCNGIGADIKFQRGDLTNSEQTQLIDLIIPIVWTAAQEKGKNVTSMVFVTITFDNGKVEAVVQ